VIFASTKKVCTVSGKAHINKQADLNFNSN
jgi:hypothetical protein